MEKVGTEQIQKTITKDELIAIAKDLEEKIKNKIIDIEQYKERLNELKKEYWIEKKYLGSSRSKEEYLRIFAKNLINEEIDKMNSRIERLNNDFKFFGIVDKSVEERKKFLRENNFYLKYSKNKELYNRFFRHVCYLNEDLNTRFNNLVNEISKKKEEIKDKVLLYYYEDVSCSNDYNEPILCEDCVLVRESAEGNGGYSNRYTIIDNRVINEGYLNGYPAVLFSCEITTFYKVSFRGRVKKTYLAGYDEGKIFLTRVAPSSSDVEDALKSLIKVDVYKAIEKGLRTMRWGDVWFIETKNDVKYDSSEIEEISIRGTHRIKGFWRGNKLYAIETLSHPTHKLIDLGGKVWLVVENRRYGYDRDID